MGTRIRWTTRRYGDQGNGVRLEPGWDRVRTGKAIEVGSGQDWVKDLRGVGARVMMGIMDLEKMVAYLMIRMRQNLCFSHYLMIKTS